MKYLSLSISFRIGFNCSNSPADAAWNSMIILLLQDASSCPDGLSSIFPIAGNILINGNGNTVVGFSLFGNYIPPGSGSLATLRFSEITDSLTAMSFDQEIYNGNEIIALDGTTYNAVSTGESTDSVKRSDMVIVLTLSISIAIIVFFLTPLLVASFVSKFLSVTWIPLIEGILRVSFFIIYSSISINPI